MALTVVLAVSGHGFGHAVRSAEVARLLIARGARVVVRTDAPAWLFPPGAEVMPSGPGGPLDIGVVQHDGLDFDVDQTRRSWRAFAAGLDARAETEARALHQVGADIVLGDVPPLAFAAARRAGVPGLALTNFGWDWIYSAWPDFEDVVECVRAGYRLADGLLRLPLHSPSEDAFPAFSVIEDVPLIARLAATPRAVTRGALNIADDAQMVLLSFGGFDLDRLDLAALGDHPDYLFVVVPPLATRDREVPNNVLRLRQAPGDYVSLLAAADAVVTKPGYGIVADCLANRVPILYTDRGPFREYDVLTPAMHSLGKARYAPRADVLAGRLGDHLRALRDAPARWTDQPMNGAAVVATRVLNGLVASNR